MSDSKKTGNSQTQNDAANDDDDPIGACQFTNASGQIVCLDNMRKSECDQIANSIFIEGGRCR